MGVRRRLVALLWRRGTMDEVGDTTIWIGIFFFLETADGGSELLEDSPDGGSEVLEDPANGGGSLDSL